ncbi:MAG: zinc-binding dehydrogenase [Isosphaeraceae bacterium]
MSRRGARTMKAAVKTEDGRFEVKEVPTPEIPAPDWVRARVRVSGICGTDLRHWKVPDPKLAGEVVGHELAGEVVEVGEAVENVRPGDRVSIETVLGDDRCDWCRVQKYNICPHLYEVRSKSVSRAYAEFVVGPAKKFYKLPDRVSFEEATLLDTFSVCLHAHHLGGVGIHDKVAVLGAGPIGLGQLMLARAGGADVIVVDVVQHSLDLARELGADAVVNSREEDPVPRVTEFSHGRGVDVAIECAGGKSMPETLPLATRFARRGGKVVIVGGFDEKEPPILLDWQRIQKSEIQLIPSASFAFWDIRPEQKMCLDLLAAGKLNAAKLITHRFKLEDINKAFETAQGKEKGSSGGSARRG